MRKACFRSVVLPLLILTSVYVAYAQAAAQGAALKNSAFSVSLQSNGEYHLAVQGSGWTLDGSLAGFSALPPTTGTDRIGRYRELSAKSENGRVATIRVYDEKPLVLFADTWEHGGKNEQPFPAFKVLPPDATRYSFVVDSFSHYEFNKLGEEGPWVFFKGSRAIVLSPADHFKISRMTVAPDGTAASEINSKIDALPDGFSHGTLLAAGDGVNAALQNWGGALQSLGGKHAVANDADPVLTKFGYWTDNGAHYYYKYDEKLGYTGTLLAVKDSFAKMGIPLGYMQLDSWFYPKGTRATWDNGGGDLPFGEQVYRADPKLFPQGLAAFHQQIGLPFVTHARWVSTSSPYHQDYKMSGNVVIDPKFWNETAAYLKDAGVITYEQDWLDKNAATEMNVTDPPAFLNEMAAGMKQQGLTMQYCMAPPSDYMASSQYQNLATIRTSDDRFEREHWDAFIYDSYLATALGAQPWVDVFMSSETGNLIIATLSGGPVGVGDALGTTSVDNLHDVMRADGVIVKPDIGLHPIERMYAEDAVNEDSPMIAVASSFLSSDVSNKSESELRTQYVFAYPRKDTDTQTSVPLHELGIENSAVAYDWVKHTATLVNAGDKVTLLFDGSSQDEAGHQHNYETSPDKDTWNFTILSPLSAKGLAVFGDPGQFAMMGRKRMQVSPSRDGGIIMTVNFASGERDRTVVGYSTHAPRVHASDGSAKVSGYNAETKIFSLQVSAGAHAQSAFTLE